MVLISIDGAVVFPDVKVVDSATGYDHSYIFPTKINKQYKYFTVAKLSQNGLSDGYWPLVSKDGRHFVISLAVQINGANIPIEELIEAVKKNETMEKIKSDDD